MSEEPSIPAAIVWDLDGTLVDSAPDITTALNALLIENGAAPLQQGGVRRMIGDGVPALIRRGFAVSRMDPDELCMASLQRRFMVIYEACAVAQTRLNPGVESALRRFATAGIPQGVCTNKPESVSRKILKELGIGTYLSTVIGGDTLPRRKPDPMPLLTAISALGATSAATLLIGDSAVDVATARAAGVRIGLVPFGYAGSPVATLGADFVIDKLQDFVFPRLSS